MTTKITQAIKREVWARDNYTCKYCRLNMRKYYLDWENGKIKRHKALITVDHVIPKHTGIDGVNNMSNLVTACHSCNNNKGGKIPTYSRIEE